jgi:hypothetical protein
MTGLLAEIRKMGYTASTSIEIKHSKVKKERRKHF